MVLIIQTSAFIKQLDIPQHASTLTFLLIAWDRLRYVRNPSKPRLPACVCVIGTWLTALCLVLPYPIYITYIDLGKHLNTLNGVGICIVNLADDMQEYMRGIFLVMYAGPLATICYLHVKISRELQSQEGSLAVVMFETRSRESRSRTDSHSTTTDFRGSRVESDGISQFSRGSFRDREGSRARYEIYESELDVPKEKRTQKYLVSMVTMYAIFLCPLMVLRLARLALLETYDNSGHFDITYTTLVWFAFLPTCSTPLLFTSWQMSRSAKERLRGYFRFSNRKLRQSCEAVITAAGGTPARRPRASSRQGDLLVRRSEDGHSESYSFHQDLVS
ncbi:hypothetical protein PPYR_06431 [Photinus pyralis]|uniref:G-protein coupled receptors family 1 profile domain-containing protein n=2 Tax=Photinus pyralis TaxID=7054 RepID=A0A5N4ATJ4_PHOPY|nr:uncharacterized protein LOC116167191 isoform X1 [Photinus pyralis]XP_031338316.1 uncharacterized protein LOC116167191 isoform X1 [Photinus pyralis]KAB0800692.1 hypothetical protein PPYR_06431 [Photinus pyralis]